MIKSDNLTIHPTLILHVAINAMKDTIRENSLVLYRHVFKFLPLFPIFRTSLPAQKRKNESTEDSIVWNEFDRYQ